MKEAKAKLALEEGLEDSYFERELGGGKALLEMEKE